MNTTAGDADLPSPVNDGAEELQASREEVLRTRVARATLIKKLCVETPRPASPAGSSGTSTAATPGAGTASWCLIFAGTNVPGADKEPGGLEAAFERAMKMLEGDPMVMGQTRMSGYQARVCGGHDGLGPYQAWAIFGEPAEVKTALVRLEESEPWARLLDLDLYTADASPVHRTALGLPPRKCLVCEEASIDCIRTGRHSFAELRGQVEALLGEFRPGV
jgi:holo-ACP synthase